SIIFLIRILKDYNERTLLQQELIKKDKETADRLQVIGGIATQISKGNYDVQIDDRKADTLGALGASIHEMKNSLKNSFDLLSQKEWLQSGVATLNDKMLGEKTIQKLSKDVIEFLCQYTNSSAGVLYVLDGEEMTISGGYSYIPSKDRER